MDKYKKVVRRGFYRLEFTAKRQPGMVGFKNLGKSHFNLKISSDKYYNFISDYMNKKITMPMNIIIYDEYELENNSDIRKVITFLKKINECNISNIKFYLSDSALQNYNSIMNQIGWKHSDVTEIYLTVDRTPTKRKVNDLNLELAMGRLIIPEEKLLWFSNNTLLKLNGKVEKGIIYRASKLKELVDVYENDIEKYYNLTNINDFDKTYMAYDYVKRILNIKFPFRYVETINGKQSLVNSCPRYISEPLGTYLKKEGVCEGQARLIRVLLNNPSIRVDATTINGECPLGSHAWVGVVIDDKLYECCPTIKGAFSNLESYIPSEDNIYTKVYERSYLNQEEINKIKKKILK